MPQKDGQTCTITRSRVAVIKKPSRWKVMMMNDDVTTMDFVVRVLQEIFNKSVEDAVEVMLNIHEKGCGIAGVYSKDIAETKRQQTVEQARAEGFPLKVEIEQE